MRKEELRKLRALPATKEMLEKGKQGNYDSLARVQNLGGYIKIALFLPEDMRKDITTPRYEIFLNVPGGEYITRELDKKGEEVWWLTSMVSNLPVISYRCRWYGNHQNNFLNRDAMKTLNTLTLEKYQTSTGLKRLDNWQQEQKDKATKRREEKEQAPWDADMKLVPELPSGFKEWMRKDAATKYFMIYEYDPKGQKTGYCSRCKNKVPIKYPKHGKKSTCSHCGAKVVMKAHSRLQTVHTDEYYGQIIQKFKSGIVIRSFVQKQWYRDRPYTDPHIYTSESERIMIFDNGIVKRYYWGNYKNKFTRWIQQKNWNPAERHNRTTKLYKRNFAQLKQHSILKQSAMDLWPELPIPADKYLAVEKANPAVEMLARLGMFKLAEELIDIRYDKDLLDEGATEIAKMLKIDKQRLKRLKDMDGNLDSLRWLQYEKQVNTIWPDVMIKDLGEAGLKVSAFGFLNPPVSFVKCYNYLKKQSAISGETLFQTWITWRDYINMADQLKMNTKMDQIARPKDVKLAHDECVAIQKSKGLEKQAKEIEKKWPKVNDQLPKLEKFEFKSGDYCIVAPKKVYDIVREGVILSHCVHTCDYYFSRIQSDESYLFFLRKSAAPDVPWYTLEVEPSGNIRQKRTTGDNQNPDFQKAVPFLKKWQKHFAKQLTEEEKELGRIANELREENYKNLRKNGNRVWHGKLAGQLLADVLEADFMAAV